MARVEPYVKVTERIVDEPTRLAVDGSANIGVVVVAPTGSNDPVLITSPTQFLNEFTVDGKIPSDAHRTLINAYYMSYFAGLVVSKAHAESNITSGLVFYKEGNTVKCEKARFNNGVRLSKKLTLTINQVESGSKYFGIIIDEVLYYAGDLAVIKESNDWIGNGLPFECLAEDWELVKNDYKSLLVNKLKKLDDYSVRLEGDNIVIEADKNSIPEINKIGGVAYTIKDWTVTPTIADVNEKITDQSRLLEVICKESNTADIYNVKFSRSRVLKGHKVFDALLTYSGVKDEKYLVSLDKEAVDNSGDTCYIDILNNIDKCPYEFIVNEDYQDIADVDMIEVGSEFGASGSSAGDDATPEVMMSAVDKLVDQESYRIVYLSSAGETNIQFVRYLASIGEANKWFTALDIPEDRVNYNSIKSYANQLQDSYNMIVVGPFDKRSGFISGQTVKIGASTLYWERVMSNRAQSSEFAPVFDASTGVMGYTNPAVLLKKSVREQLISLNLPVNWVIYNQNSGSYYLNDNWTHYSKSENVAGEEQNVRCAHRISLDIDDIMKQFKSRQNTTKTRMDVTDIINLYFRSEIMTQNYHPDEFLVICDETNNTDKIVNARKLAVTVKVRYYNSIKYIDVVNELYSVGGAEFTE